MIWRGASVASGAWPQRSNTSQSLIRRRGARSGSRPSGARQRRRARPGWLRVIHVGLLVALFLSACAETPDSFKLERRGPAEEPAAESAEQLDAALLEDELAKDSFRRGEYQAAIQHALGAAEMWWRLRHPGEALNSYRLAVHSLAQTQRVDEAVGLLALGALRFAQSQDRDWFLHWLEFADEVLRETGHTPKVVNLLTAGLQRYTKAFGDTHGEARLRKQLGEAYSSVGRFDDALHEYHRARTLFERAGDSIYLAQVLTSIAALHNVRGDFLAAAAILRDAEDVVSTTRLAELQLALLAVSAAVHQSLGDHVVALEKAAVAKSLLRGVTPKANLYAIVLLADVYFLLGDYGTAEELLTLLAMEKAHSVSVSAPSVLTALARVYWARRDYRRAEEAARRALAAVPQDIRALEDRSKALSSLADALLGQARYDEALEVTDQVVAQALPAGESALLLRGYTLRGAVLNAKGRHAEAAESLRRAIQISEQLVSQEIPGRQRDSVFSYPEVRAPYEMILSPLWGAYARAQSENERARIAEEALRYAEALKTRRWADRLAQRRTGITTDEMLGELIAREVELAKRATTAYGRYLEALGEPGTSAALVADRKAAWEHAAASLKEAREELRHRYPRYAARRFPDVFDLQALRIAEDEVVLAYKVTPFAVFVWTVAHRSGSNHIVEFMPLIHPQAPDPESSDQLVSQLLRRLRAGRFDADDMQTVEILSARLLKPALKAVGMPRRLSILPDGPLALVPFELLWPGLSRGEDPGPLSIQYYPSARVMATMRSSRSSRELGPASLFAVGDPDYGEDEGRRLTGSRQARRDAARRRGYALQRLVHSRMEVERIGAAFGERGGKSLVLVGIDSTESRVKAANMANFRYLHFAVHGILSYDIPLIGEPALVLGNEDPEAAEDGFLTLSEIERLTLDANLVTLSACKTGLGEELAGEGLMSLGRAFIDAGAHAVVVSLWDVDDRATALFMEDFYQLLSQGVKKAEALATAKRNLQRRGYSNPFFWAPFVLIGE